MLERKTKVQARPGQARLKDTASRIALLYAAAGKTAETTEWQQKSAQVKSATE
jgi:hypothetical protein